MNIPVDISSLRCLFSFFFSFLYLFIPRMKAVSMGGDGIII